MWCFGCQTNGGSACLQGRKVFLESETLALRTKAAGAKEREISPVGRGSNFFHLRRRGRGEGGSHFILPLPSYFLAPPGETRGIGGEGSPDWRRRKGEEEVWNSEDDEWTSLPLFSDGRAGKSLPALRAAGCPPKREEGGGKQRMGKVAVDGRKVKRETFSPTRDRMRGIHQFMTRKEGLPEATKLLHPLLLCRSKHFT